MKKFQKTKKLQKNKPKKVTAKLSVKVKLAHLDRPILRHLRLLELKHTGKIVHHRHTSHLLLMIILLILGIFLFASGYFASAKSLVESQSVSVTATVEGSPITNEVVTKPKIDNDFIEWFETPVPLYLMLVMLTLGFWVGDLFDRKFGISKSRSKFKKAS
ncbi:MAG: hypothetical protein WCQ49_03095 [Candidatus Saccharibacteria bacterium]